MIMHVRIIAVGKVKEKYLQEGIAEYEKRLRPYLDLQILEINEEKRPASASASDRKVSDGKGRRTDPCCNTLRDRSLLPSI